MEGAIEVDAGFLVDGDPVGAGFGEGGDEVVGAFDHEMAVERDLGDLAEGGDYGRADLKIGDEMAVHDVDVEDGGAAFDGGLRLLTESGEVGREDGRSEFNHGNASWSLEI